MHGAARRFGGEEAAQQWAALEKRMAPLQQGAALFPAAALRNDAGDSWPLPFFERLRPVAGLEDPSDCSQSAEGLVNQSGGSRALRDGADNLFVEDSSACSSTLAKASLGDVERACTSLGWSPPVTCRLRTPSRPSSGLWVSVSLAATHG